jgi:hypothetical protein
VVEFAAGRCGAQWAPWNSSLSRRSHATRSGGCWASPVASAIPRPPVCVCAPDARTRISAAGQQRARLYGKSRFKPGAEWVGARLELLFGGDGRRLALRAQEDDEDPGRLIAPVERLMPLPHVLDERLPGQVLARLGAFGLDGEGSLQYVDVVLSALAPASVACAELKPTRGQAASKMPSTVTVLRRRSSLQRSAGTCW